MILSMEPSLNKILSVDNFSRLFPVLILDTVFASFETVGNV